MKRSKKKPKLIPRRTWKFNPATRVVKDKKKYNRKRAKGKMRELEEL